MSLKVDKSVWNQIKKNLAKGNSLQVSVGFFEDARYTSENDNLPVATVAAWMEEGDPTQYPPRPFMRAGFVPMLKGTKYREVFAKSIENILEGKSTFVQEYNKLGPVMQKDLKQVIIDWDTPPNSPATIAEKGFNDPLIDTGTMRDSVDFKVEKKE